MSNESTPVDADAAPWSTINLVNALRRTIAGQLEAYKTCVLHEFQDEPEALLRLLHLTLTEAEGLAWSTPYAHLLLPVLIGEKLESVRRWVSHQHSMSDQTAKSSHPLLPT